MKNTNKHVRLNPGVLFLFATILAFVPTLTASGVDCYLDTGEDPVVRYCPASTGNYRHQNRSSSKIDYIVIHTVQGSMKSAVNTFASPDIDYPRSAHYTIGKSGEIIKSVSPDMIAWHAGTSPPGSGGKYESYVLNDNSIGIEHAGYVDDPDFPTRAQYISSAALTRYLCEKYNIPIDREHIVGHDEIKYTKGDPGPNWDWGYYLDLVRNGSRHQPGIPGQDYNLAAAGGSGFNFLSAGMVVAGLSVGVLGFLLGGSLPD